MLFAFFGYCRRHHAHEPWCACCVHVQLCSTTKDQYRFKLLLRTPDCIRGRHPSIQKLCSTNNNINDRSNRCCHLFTHIGADGWVLSRQTEFAQSSSECILKYTLHVCLRYRCQQGQCHQTNQLLCSGGGSGGGRISSSTSSSSFSSVDRLYRFCYEGRHDDDDDDDANNIIVLRPTDDDGRLVKERQSLCNSFDRGATAAAAPK